MRSEPRRAIVDGRRVVAKARHNPMGRVVTLLATIAATVGGLEPSLPHDGSQPDAPRTGVKRKSYHTDQLRELAEEAREWKIMNDVPHTPKNGKWMAAFLVAKHGAVLPAEEYKAKHLELRAATKVVLPERLAARPATKGWTPRPGCCGGGLRLTSCRPVAKRERRRRPFARTRFCQELDEEVWLWFVDRLATNKTRVGVREIVNAASSYKNAVLADWRARCDEGAADRRDPPKIPEIGPEWAKRWRYRYRVTYRTVNLRYKIPRHVFLDRLRIFWSNIIIVRALYEQFYTDSLRFVGFDQKPLWFNAIAEERTLTYEGQPMVGVAENVSASRARFTAMTHCRSWVESCAPPIALLFKIGEAACSLDNLRESLVCKGRTLIQGGIRGSYRLSQVIEFLTWVLTGLQPERPVCVLLDWFAPHLDESVDVLCNERGHAVLRIGGGLTPAVQVPDTHAHRPYSLHYRELEKSAAAAAWDIRPGSLLECSRQSVLSRAEEAWDLVDHCSCAQGWLHNAITIPLDGTGDGGMGSRTKLLWDEVGMDGIRPQLIQDVKDAIESGEVGCFMDYKKLLLLCDDHDPLQEGLRAATYIYDEGGAHAPMDIECGDGPLMADEGVACADAPIDAAIAKEALDFEAAGPGAWLPNGSQPDAPPVVPHPGLQLDVPPVLPPLAERLAARCGPHQRNALDAITLDSPPPVPSGTPPLGRAPLPPPPSSPPPASAAAAAQQHSKGPGLQPDCSPPTPPQEDTESARVVRTLSVAARELRKVGQIRIADYLVGQATVHVRRARGDPDIQRALQTETAKRKRNIAEVRQEDADARHRLQERKLELKVASEARLAASHAAKEAAALARAADAAAKTHRQALAASAKEASAAAQKAEEVAKAAKDKEKKTHAETLARRAKRRLTCAGALAEALRRQIQDKDSGESRKAALLTFTNTRKGKVPWKNMAKLPALWDHGDNNGLRRLSLKGGVIKVH